MDRIYETLFSLKTMLLLMLLFAIAIGTATFIESFQNIEAAKILVFNSLWFTLLIALLMLNGIGIIVKFRMWRKAKRSAFLFHFAFVVILIGAAVSRFTGFEGQMIIKEGKSSSTIYSSDPYLYVGIQNADGTKSAYEFKKWFSEYTPWHNSFTQHVETSSGKIIEIKYLNYLEDVFKVPVQSNKGDDYLNLVIPGQMGMDSILVKSGELNLLNNVVSVSYNSNIQDADINIFESDSGAYMISAIPITSLSMSKLKEMSSGEDISPDSLSSGRKYKLQTGTLYNAHNTQFVFKRIERNIHFEYRKVKTENSGIDVLQLTINYEGKTSSLNLEGGPKMIRELYQHKFDDATVIYIGYGPKQIRLPFKLECLDFRLENYPGSMSPSSFECDLMVHDKEKSFKSTIFMNHVLDYSGYRFFQSSYSSSTGAPQINPDTTVLSVNHDLPGTIISYIGYFLLALGFVWNLISKTSRFTLVKTLKLVRPGIKKSGLILLLFISSTLHAQKSELFLNLSNQDVKEVNSILIQNQVGRIGTLQTHAIDVLNKVSRRSEYKEKTPTEVYLSLILKGPAWNNEEIIYVQNPDVQSFLNLQGKYATINSFRDEVTHNLKSEIIKEYQTSYEKRDAVKTKFDKELIKTIERYFILESIQQGRDLSIYPTTDHQKKWLSIYDVITQDLTDSDIFKLNKEFILALASQKDINQKANSIKKHQFKFAASYIPSKTKISTELLYNKLNIFSRLLYIYGTIGFILLILLFIHVFTSSRLWIEHVLRTVFFLLFLMGIIYAAGLGMRWYITDHAPWSNGFEALIFVGFACQIAGLIFYKTSKFSLIATSILTFLIMGIAHGANVDPELTNLAPVLKSVWLVIHVAVMTSSYGFLGMGAVMCSLNLILYATGKKENVKIPEIINEFTFTAERTFTIGLFLAAIGMFLGGIWANESWGRYWGWDPKETWALVIVLMYAILLHIRMIPKMQSAFLFNALGVWLYSTVIMTYFGVNYYLVSGLHSYARGDRSYLPQWAKITILIYLLVTIIGAIRTRKSLKLK